MKSPLNDRLHGLLHRVKGNAKELVGIAIDDPAMEGRGKAEKNAGVRARPCQ